MTTWSEIFNSEVDPDSPFTTSLATRYRDNPEAIMEGDATALSAGRGVAIEKSSQTAVITDTTNTTRFLRPDGSGSVEFAALTGQIDQAALDTATGTVSATSEDQLLSLPGGSYGFYPQVRFEDIGALDGDVFVTMGVGLGHANWTERDPTSLNTAYDALIFLSAETGAGQNIDARQRYVNASPPYDLGDGEIPLFVYLRVAKGTGAVLASYVANVPPWAYNGPTSVRADLVYADRNGVHTKRQFKPGARRQWFDYVKSVKENDGKIVDEDILPFTVEIDNSIKNADMSLRPHPFLKPLSAAEKIVLLDPPATEELLWAHEEDLPGESVMTMLLNQQRDRQGRKLSFGNVDISSRSRPASGIEVVSFTLE